MNTLNRHIHTGTQNVHNAHNAHIDNIGIPKHEKHLRLLSSGTKLFYYLWVKRFFDMRRKIHNLSMLTFSSALDHVRHPPQTTSQASMSFESQPSYSEAGTQLSDFSQITKILRVRFRCMASFTSPGNISYLGFLFRHLWMTHAPRTCVNTCAHVAPN